MTRVSENSQTHSLKFAINKVKSKMEDLQMKGSNLKNITRPSDNPLANVESMEITSTTTDNSQFKKNSDFALLQLTTTEQALVNISDILNKAKEIAITQSSDFYGEDIRRNIANEVYQLKNQALAVANKRVGNRYIFSGYKTLTKPFDQDGNYYGDANHVELEISKDFFVPINLHGAEVFFAEDDVKFESKNPLENLKQQEIQQNPDSQQSRDLASNQETDPLAKDKFQRRFNIFTQLDNLISALENDDPQMIQGLLEKFDASVSRLITLRTRIGSIMSSIEASKSTIDTENLAYAERKSKLVDADIAELFADLTKQQDILRTTYKASQTTLNQSLMDFLR